MPIIVRQALAGTLGQLAVRAGQVRGQQLQMDRDIQLTSIALAAQDRMTAMSTAAQDRDRTFALQRAAATQMARQRPAEPETLKRRIDLQKFVSEAEETGIYESSQIKQAQIFADIGDEKSVRAIFGKLPEPTALQQQFKAVTEIGQTETEELQRQLDALNIRLEKRFTPGTQRLLRERPAYMATIAPDMQEALAQQQQLEEQISAVQQRTTRMGQFIQMGISIPQQMAIEARRKTELARQEEVAQRRLVQQTRAKGELTERDELVIDELRDREKEQRVMMDREIARLSRDLAPFQNEEAGDKDYIERVTPINTQIRQLKLDQVASFAREKEQVENFLRGGVKRKQPTGGYVKGRIYTNAVGQRARFIGYDVTGKPLVELME